ncbi:nickel pincer cofactor biosynthesis protein LarB [Trichothermofontia sp.]
MDYVDSLRQLLDAVAQGEVDTEAAIARLKYLAFEPVGDFARLDHQRSLRNGFPEVIWGPGKTVAQIVQIMQAMRRQQPVVMATRITPKVYAQIQADIPEAQYFPLARICALITGPESGAESGMVSVRSPGTIGVLSAGTADLPVAEEAAITAELSGFRVQRLWDVGVAGLQRLLSHLDLLAQMQVMIVVAGMEGALPSVVAGLVDSPVIAVPTSIGYGASFNGLAPLLTMLNSCASGVGVVNIDNGFGAAILAGQILRTAAKLNTQSIPEGP